MAVTTKRMQDVNQIAEHFRKMMAEELGRFTVSCLSCEHFNETGELCRLVDRRPPAKVIAYGCNKWEEQIPF